jgi:hypothetical protein
MRNKAFTPLELHKWPSVFVKYTHMQWAQKMVEEGSVRIGTLYEYKTFEEHGGNIYDADEGVRRIGMVDIDGMSWHPYNQAKVAYLSDTVGIHMTNCRDCVIAANKQDHASDAYIYSVSGELSHDCAVACHEEYDAFVIIWNIFELGRRISDKLSNSARFLGFSNVIYIDGYAPFDWVGHIPPGRIKQSKFSMQNEFRAIWAPASHPLTPQVLTLGPLHKICSCWPLSALEALQVSPYAATSFT